MSMSTDFIPSENEKVTIRSSVFPPTSERGAFGTLTIENQNGKINLFVHGPEYLKKLADEALKLEAEMRRQQQIAEAIANITAGKPIAELATT